MWIELSWLDFLFGSVGSLVGSFVRLFFGVCALSSALAFKRWQNDDDDIAANASKLFSLFLWIARRPEKHSSTRINSSLLPITFRFYLTKFASMIICSVQILFYCLRVAECVVIKSNNAIAHCGTKEFWTKTSERTNGCIWLPFLGKLKTFNIPYVSIVSLCKIRCDRFAGQFK